MNDAPSHLDQFRYAIVLNLGDGAPNDDLDRFVDSRLCPFTSVQSKRAFSYRSFPCPVELNGMAGHGYGRRP
jgi:hypothetical protein